MAGQSPGLIKAFKASGALAARTFVKFGSDDETVVAATAGSDVIGVTTEIPAADGETVDVIMGNIADVKFGGVVARGKLVMSDASGEAVLAAASAGANVRTAGMALFTAADGDIGPVFLMPGSFQG
jgi:hypothetical protein